MAEDDEDRKRRKLGTGAFFPELKLGLPDGLDSSLSYFQASPVPLDLFGLPNLPATSQGLSAFPIGDVSLPNTLPAHEQTLIAPKPRRDASIESLSAPTDAENDLLRRKLPPRVPLPGPAQVNLGAATASAAAMMSASATQEQMQLISYLSSLSNEYVELQRQYQLTQDQKVLEKLEKANQVRSNVVQVLRNTQRLAHNASQPQGPSRPQVPVALQPPQHHNLGLASSSSSSSMGPGSRVAAGTAVGSWTASQAVLAQQQQQSQREHPSVGPISSSGKGQGQGQGQGQGHGHGPPGGTSGSMHQLAQAIAQRQLQLQMLQDEEKKYVQQGLNQNSAAVQNVQRRKQRLRQQLKVQQQQLLQLQQVHHQQQQKAQFATASDGSHLSIDSLAASLTSHPRGETGNPGTVSQVRLKQAQQSSAEAVNTHNSAFSKAQRTDLKAVLRLVTPLYAQVEQLSKQDPQAMLHLVDRVSANCHLFLRSVLPKDPERQMPPQTFDMWKFELAEVGRMCETLDRCSDQSRAIVWNELFEIMKSGKNQETSQAFTPVFVKYLQTRAPEVAPIIAALYVAFRRCLCRQPNLMTLGSGPQSSPSPSPAVALNTATTTGPTSQAPPSALSDSAPNSASAASARPMTEPSPRDVSATSSAASPPSSSGAASLADSATVTSSARSASPPAAPRSSGGDTAAARTSPLSLPSTLPTASALPEQKL